MKTTTKNIAKQIVITMVLFLCIILPFLPGDFDPLANQISLVVQTFSAIGLITCVPALLWLYYSLKSRNKTKDTVLLSQKKMAKIYVYTFSVAFLLVALMTTLTLSLSLGIVLFVFLVFSARFTLDKITKSSTETLATFHLPLFLTLLPILLIVFNLIVDKPLVDWSRNKAIAKSKELIDEIENCKTVYGKYPLSLNAVHKDYNTGIIGIEKYHYTYDNTTYNLYFEQPKLLFDQFGTREFIVYNPNDNHLMISHASWNARWRPEQIRTTQGWYNSKKIEHEHWKSFWFD